MEIEQRPKEPPHGVQQNHSYMAKVINEFPWSFSTWADFNNNVPSTLSMMNNVDACRAFYIPYPSYIYLIMQRYNITPEIKFKVSDAQHNV